MRDRPSRRGGNFHIRRSSVHNSLEAIDESNVARAGITLETYEVLERVRVPVRTLESLCDDLRVERIDVLHIDAQGADMDVLISAGRLLQTVRAGVVEVGRRLNLYSIRLGGETSFASCHETACRS